MDLNMPIIPGSAQFIQEVIIHLANYLGNQRGVASTDTNIIWRDSSLNKYQGNEIGKKPQSLKPNKEPFNTL